MIVACVYSVLGGKGQRHHLYRIISTTFPYSSLCACLPLALTVWVKPEKLWETSSEDVRLRKQSTTHQRQRSDVTPQANRAAGGAGLLPYCPSHPIPSQLRRCGHAGFTTRGTDGRLLAHARRWAGYASTRSPSAVTSRRHLPNLDAVPGSVRVDNIAGGERFRGEL